MAELDGEEAIAALEARIAAAEPGQPLARTAADFERYVAESVAANRHRMNVAVAAEAERMAAEAAPETAPVPTPPPTRRVPKMKRSPGAR